MNTGPKCLIKTIPMELFYRLSSVSAKNFGIHSVVKRVKSEVMEEHTGKLLGDQSTTQISPLFLEGWDLDTINLLKEWNCHRIKSFDPKRCSSTKINYSNYHLWHLINIPTMYLKKWNFVGLQTGLKSDNSTNRNKISPFRSSSSHTKLTQKEVMSRAFQEQCCYRSLL